MLQINTINKYFLNTLIIIIIGHFTSLATQFYWMTSVFSILFGSPTYGFTTISFDSDLQSFQPPVIKQELP